MVRKPEPVYCMEQTKLFVRELRAVDRMGTGQIKGEEESQQMFCHIDETLFSRLPREAVTLAAQCLRHSFCYTL